MLKFGNLIFNQNFSKMKNSQRNQLTMHCFSLKQTQKKPHVVKTANRIDI